MLLKRHRSRYGGHLVHLGVLIATIGITASLFHKVEREFLLAPGEKYSIGRYILSLENLRESNQPHYEALLADIGVSMQGEDAKRAIYTPEIRVYRKNQETTSEVVIRKSFLEDLYLVLSGFEPESGRASFKVYVNPLQSFLWAGVGIMILGTLLVIGPFRVRVPHDELVAQQTV
jgi:cytochrome c-type biogenesis protein CcmF